MVFMCVWCFRDFRYRAARNLARTNGILVLFWPLLGRDRPEINFWLSFKAKKVTLWAMSENRKSQGRKKWSQHWFIPAGKLKVAFFSKIAKSQNTHKCTDILRLLGAEIAKIWKCWFWLSFKAKMDESEGDFREVAFFVFPKSQKKHQ